MINARNLRKTFGKVVALDDLSFEAQDGLVTGLLGPNGAGKSTALRILSGVLRPDAGQAQVDGCDTQQQPMTTRAACGILPHNAGIYERLSGRENIRYYGRLNGLRGEGLKARIGELVSLLDMDEFVDRRAKGYSQGQRTKVALARALVHRPKNVVLDEPSNGLDVMATRGLRQLIKTLRDQGHCVLFSSHVMQEVGALCDHIVIMDKGRVVAGGSPQTLREQTGQEDLENAFVAAIGSDEGLV